MNECDGRDFLKRAGATLTLFTTINNLALSINSAEERTFDRIGVNYPQIYKILKEMDSKGYRFLSVPWKDGEFLHLIVKAVKAKSVLEVGTSQGFSSIWIGLGLEETGGNLTTIEINEEYYLVGRRNIEKAGLSHKITCINGDAHKVVTKLEGPFDFVFLDADKEGQMDYFEKLYPKKLLPGGMIIVHNAITQKSAMRDYLNMISKHPDFDTVFLSVTMSDGFALSYRHRIP